MSLYLGNNLLAGFSTNTTTTYNANNLLDYKWTDYELSDQSWLCANTFSWQNGTTYNNAYSHLVNDLTEQNTSIIVTDNLYGWSITSGVNLLGSEIYTKTDEPTSSSPVFRSNGSTLSGYFSKTANSDTITFTFAISSQSFVQSTYRRNSSLDTELFAFSPDTNVQTETIEGITIEYILANDGHKIVTPSASYDLNRLYNKTGVAWYYVLDTTNQRFKLPHENPTREELIQTVRAKGDGNTIGYQITADGETRGVAEFSSYRMATTTTTGAVGDSATVVTMNQGKFVGLTKDSTQSGIISDMEDSTSVYKGKKYLYFYVGQFSQSATEQTAGLNASLFNGKIDLDGSNATFPHIIEAYNNGTDWYNLYSNGWCEQGGYISDDGTTSVNINLLKQYSGTNYSIQITQHYGANAYPAAVAGSTWTTSGFNVYKPASVKDFWWETKGYTI